MNQQVQIAKAIFGLSEHDLPAAGIEHVAVWPVIESVPGRFGSPAIAYLRQRLAWQSMARHANSIMELELCDAPSGVARRIQKNRRRAGLSPATVR